MRLPVRGTKASRLHEEYGIYLQVRLQSDPECADLAHRWAASQESLLAALQRCTDARRATMRSLADRDGADVAMDREVRVLHRTITALVKSNSRSVLLQSYFPEGSYPVTSSHPSKEVGLVEGLLQKLEKEPEPRLAALAEPLRAAFQVFQAAVSAHDAAMQAARTAFELEQMARLQWFASYEKTRFDLCSRFVEDPARVETYFRSAGKSARLMEVGAEEEADPAAPEVVAAASSGSAPTPLAG